VLKPEVMVKAADVNVSSVIGYDGVYYVFVAAVLTAMYAFGGYYLVFWLMAVGYLLFEYWKEMRSPIYFTSQPSRNISNRIAFALAVAVAVLAAFVINRPDADDSLYINMAVSVLDHPGSPIFSTDSLHGIPGIYILPTYFVHSYELLAALFSNLLSVNEPVYVFHLLFSPFFCVFSVFSTALCFQRLLPRWWGWACFVLTLEYILLTGTHRMYGNFAYARMFQGKSVFITAIIPLIVVYAMDFYIRPRLSTWLMLALVQICAIGLTSNALYIAPLTAGFALFACWRPSLTDIRNLGFGLLASAYPVFAGLVIRSIVIKGGLKFENFQEFIPIASGMNMVLGDGFTLWLWLLAVTCTWSVVRDPGIRRWLVRFSFIFVVLCLNPFLDQFWGNYVTAKYLTWRLFWIMPLPIFLSIFITQAFANRMEKNGSSKGHLLVMGFIALVVILVMVIDKPWVQPGIFVDRSRYFDLKVPRPEYDIAVRLNEIAGKDSPVLAPEEISAWIPTFRNHAFPLVARVHYTESLLTVFANKINTQDIQERMELEVYINGVSTDITLSENILKNWLHDEKISVIVIPINFKFITSLESIMQRAGFERTEYLGYYFFSK